MKRLLFILIVLTVAGCKKSDDSGFPLVASVSGMTSKTSITMKFVDNSSGGLTILIVTNQFGDQSFSTPNLKSGASIVVTYSTNIPDDKAGNGDGAIKFSYNGASVGAVGGILTGTTTVHIP